MRINCLIGLMSLLLILGLSVLASAGWETDPPNDTANNSTVGNYDIEGALVEVYPDGAGLEEYMNVCIDMTNSVPGFVLIELDTDGNSATGQTIPMTGIFDSCEGGTKLKTESIGSEIGIFLFLRDQGDTISTAWCSNCWGPSGTCTEKGLTCDCDQENCYTAGAVCGPNTEGCYVRSTDCTSGGGNCQEGGEYCSVMTERCETSDPCYMGRARGEWYANPMIGGGSAMRPAARGRVDLPLPKGPGDADSGCYKLPWRRIVEKSKSINPSLFDGSEEDATKLRYQISTWYSPDFGTTESDFMDETASPPCLEVTDVVPNTGSLNAQASDGRLCHKYQNMLEVCFDKMANQRNVEDQVGSAGCYFNTSITDQTTCEAAGCTWWADKERCVNDMCLGDFNKDTKVKAQERNILMKETARTGCPTCE